jgi:hypothetical protein
MAAAGTLFLSAIQPADARGFAGGAGLRGAGHMAEHPAVAARPGETPKPKRAFRFGRHRWAFASGVGYGLPWGDGSYDPTDAGQASVPSGEGYPPPPPPWLYGYGPPHQSCFKPRIITIGKAPPKSHLPRVIYGGPLPCRDEGT